MPGHRSAMARMVALVRTDAGWRRSSAACASRQAVRRVDHRLLARVEVAPRHARPAALVGPEVREEPRHAAARPRPRVPRARVRQLQVLAGAGDRRRRAAAAPRPPPRPSAPGRSAGARRRAPRGTPRPTRGPWRRAATPASRPRRSARAARRRARRARRRGPRRSADRRPSAGPPRAASASETSACSASQRSRLAPRPSGGVVGPARAAQDVPHRLRHRRPGVRGARPAAQQDQRLAHVRAGEEPGVAAHLVARCPGRPAPPRTPPTARWSGTGPRSRRRDTPPRTSAAIASVTPAASASSSA